MKKTLRAICVIACLSAALFSCKGKNADGTNQAEKAESVKVQQTAPSLFIYSGWDLYEERESADNPDKIEFDHKVYYFLGGKMNMKIRLQNPLAKSQKAKLYFYDAHNGNSEQGYLELKLKKGKAEIEIKDFAASQIGIWETELSDAILHECGDYWVKVVCVLELADGTRIDLDGSARLYFEMPML